MTPPAPPLPLGPKDQEDYLVQHIPHRVRAVLADIPAIGAWRLPPLLVVNTPTNLIVNRCYGNGVHEGRLTAMRWLVMFVGITYSDATRGPTVYRLKDPLKDVRIDRMDGGELFEPHRADALILAKVQDGCSKATSHPTIGTNHFKVEPPQLAEALNVVVDHLQRTIYGHKKLRLIDEVMRTHGP